MARDQDAADFLELGPRIAFSIAARGSGEKPSRCGSCDDPTIGRLAGRFLGLNLGSECREERNRGGCPTHHSESDAPAS